MRNWNTIPVLDNERARPENLRAYPAPRVRGAVARMFETTMNVPTRHLRELTARLNRAGFTVLDTGARVMTDDGPEGEATVKLLHIPTVEIADPAEIELGVSV